MSMTMQILILSLYSSLKATLLHYWTVIMIVIKLRHWYIEV